MKDCLMKHGNTDGRFSKALVISCVIAVTGYLALYSVFKFNNPLGTWDTAITAGWFAFWGGELVALASIRKTKIRNKYEQP